MLNFQDSANSRGGYSLGDGALDGVQIVIGIAGLIPGWGNIADGANAAISAGRGDTVGATMDGASAIPAAGQGAGILGISTRFGRIWSAIMRRVPDGALQTIIDFQRRKGNFSIGQLTARQADDLGQAFVGPNAVNIVKNGKVIGVRSANGLRQYRFPAEKIYGQAGGSVQANIEEFVLSASGKKSLVRNGHIDIVGGN